MKELLLDASSWRSKDDFYDAFFQAVGAPSWHGRNFDALNDSIGTGQINKIEVPYRIVIVGKAATPEATQLIEDFDRLIQRLAGNGCPVELVRTPREKK